MGKFDGVLLVSDYDGTFAVGNNIPQDNLDMLAYFEAQGGRFTVATGRTHCTFRIVRSRIPFNAPVLLANGALVYDFDREEILAQSPLPPTTREDMVELSRVFPRMALEVYSGENDLYAWNPNFYVRRHMEYTGARGHICPIAEIPLPWDKAIMEHDHKTLLTFQAEILKRWGDRYEVIFSDDHMLELNAKGCTKGSAVLKVAEALGIRRSGIYCVGDNETDISMLKISAIPFAPKNAIPAVKETPGVVVLPHCKKGAIGALIRHLDAIY